MSGGITDAPKPKFEAAYSAVAQGSTAGELMDSLAELPRDAKITWVDSHEETSLTLFGPDTSKITAGIGFKWPASPTP